MRLDVLFIYFNLMTAMIGSVWVRAWIITLPLYPKRDEPLKVQFLIRYVIHLEVVTRFTRDRFDMCSQKFSAVVLKMPLDVPLITKHATTDRNCSFVRAFKALCLRSRRSTLKSIWRAPLRLKQPRTAWALCVYFIFFNFRKMDWDGILLEDGKRA